MKFLPGSNPLVSLNDANGAKLSSIDKSIFDVKICFLFNSNKKNQ